MKVAERFKSDKNNTILLMVSIIVLVTPIWVKTQTLSEPLKQPPTSAWRGLFVINMIGRLLSAKTSKMRMDQRRCLSLAPPTCAISRQGECYRTMD